MCRISTQIERMFGHFFLSTTGRDPETPADRVSFAAAFSLFRAVDALAVLSLARLRRRRRAVGLGRGAPIRSATGGQGKRRGGFRPCIAFRPGQPCRER